MKYAHYDKKEKTLLGYYDDEIHDTIPTPNIEISDEDWLRALNENANSVDMKNKKLVRIETQPKRDELAELEKQIRECEDDIKHALIIGNNAVLESLRAELKELIVQREELRK
ncbi:hypothetical protein G5B95_08625 [Campylobacter concisus]|uniref:hypothetical protein n=1 Tax=Campylobacter concisus TaxID=199 RepID=UPI0018ABB71E|nr:hypothetical protein [Campylobacter concisus]QPI03708.1 hypothetical protein G5B95_08625 [Campylobacter concisus]DAJ39644.1 MAG TPA: hypothetical protein [Caudoviricetes sp.]